MPERDIKRAIERLKQALAALAVRDDNRALICIASASILLSDVSDVLVDRNIVIAE